MNYYTKFNAAILVDVFVVSEPDKQHFFLNESYNLIIIYI